MGQGAHRGVVDPGSGNLGQVLEGNTTRCFELGSTGAAPHGGAQAADVEVVEQDQLGSGGEGFVQLDQVGHLDLDQLGRRHSEAGRGQGSSNATGRTDVVLLDQEAVVKTATVVPAAANSDGVLLENAHAGGGLAGVDHLGA